MNYKDTLLMPKTKFEMRGNLAKKEPITREFWEAEQIYEKRLQLNSNNKMFVLHDGPPYANGNLHMGHALNKIVKDFVVRSKSMQGMYSPYILGWDTHGLPIETAITKTGINRKEYGINEFRDICRDYALEQIANQKTAFKEYSILGNFADPYITLDKYYEGKQLEVFATMVEKGLIYKGLRPVYWSPSSESALAEAEIEYYNKKSPAVFVKFNVVKGLDYPNSSLVIWTTTPWTLPANLAITVSETITYAIVKVKEEHLVVAKQLVEELMSKFAITDYEVVAEVQGSALSGAEYQHVYLDRISPVILGDHVSIDSGSALVHTAPGHGEEDFNIGKEYGLEFLCPVDGRGYLTKEAGMFSGLHVDDANKAIVKYLDEQGYLLHFEMIEHSYPHDWRTKKPVIFRATAQWFASIDKIRNDILTVINNDVNWYPSWGEKRLYNMIKDRGDWCISRQRVWGVPIPILYDENEEGILDANLILHFAKLFSEHGSNIWYEWDVEQLLPEGYTHAGSPNHQFTKETDIMDVWFDSGSSHYAVIDKYKLNSVHDLYLEGNDQFRGWFNSSLITSVALNNQAPYHNVVAHGMILDGKGYKMSKSLNNVIDPKDLIKQFGTDILRLWVASVDYQQDMKMSLDNMQRVTESYKKFRNTFKYLVGNLNTLTSVEQLVAYDDLDKIDKYMLHQLNDLNSAVIAAYNAYDFQEVFKLTNKYIADLSSFYLDYAKDSLYADHINSLHRSSIQTVLYYNLHVLMRLLTPIMPHTTEELYSFVSVNASLESVYLENFITNLDVKDDDFSDVELFFTVRKSVLKALELMRDQKVIGKSLEAKVTLNLPKAEVQQLTNLGKLSELLVVSEVEFTTDTLPVVEDYQVQVEKMAGEVCPRCWNIFPSLDGECSRCKDVLNN